MGNCEKTKNKDGENSKSKALEGGRERSSEEKTHSFKRQENSLNRKMNSFEYGTDFGLASKKDYLKQASCLYDVFTILIISLIFYFLFLGEYPFFNPDESRYSEIAREMITFSDYLTPHLNGLVFLDKPILHYWLQSVMIKLFGMNMFSLRIIPSLFAIGGLLITYLFGRYFFNRQVGFVSALILLSSPLYFACAHYADMNIEVAFFVTATLFFFLKGIFATTHRYIFFICAYIAAALGFLTKGLIALAFPFLIIVCWSLLTSQIKLLKKIYFFRGILLITLIGLPWCLFMQNKHPVFFDYYFMNQHVDRFLSNGEFNNEQFLLFYLPVVLLGLFPWVLFLYPGVHRFINPIKDAKNYTGIELLLLIWPLIILVFFSIPKSKIVGYILPLFPSVALIVGAYFAHNAEITLARQIRYLFAAVYFSICLAITYFLNFSNAFPLQFLSHLIIVNIILFTVAIILMIGNISKLRTFFYLFLFSNCVFLLVLTHGAKYYNRHSTFPLVSIFKKLANPADEIISYHGYFYDLPLYLERTVQVAINWQTVEMLAKDNWASELYKAKSFTAHQKIWINEKTFWRKWNSDKTIYAVLHINNFHKILRHTRKFHIVKQHRKILLITNRRMD